MKRKLWMFLPVIVAPLPLSAISCGASQTNMKGVNNTPVEGPKVAQVESYKIDINNVPNTLKPFSFDSLSKEAKELNDSSEWVGGIEYHAASSAIAFIRNLAESYGYSTDIDPITKKTSKQDFLDKNGFVYIDDNKAKAILAQPNDSSINGVNGVSLIPNRHLSIKEKRKVLQSIGKDGGMANDKNDASNYTSGHLENYNLQSPNLLFGSDQFSVYPDYRTKQANVEIYSFGEKLIRKIDVPDIIDLYPTLTNDKLQEYAPLMKYLLNKFLTIYQGNEEMALDRDLASIAPETVDQLNFLVKKNLVASTDENGNATGKFTLDDKEFIKHLAMLNNGTTHWLAIKAILCGLDSTLADKSLILFTGDKTWPALNIDPKVGIKDMASIIGLKNWGGKGRLVMQSTSYKPEDDLALIHIDSDHTYPATFVAGKTIDELYKINDIEQATRVNIETQVDNFYTISNY